MDKEKLIATLRKYEQRISDKEFDLEAWKSSAIPLISRIFGDRSGKVVQLESLKIDYSSWALRDAPSTYQPLESCKRKAKEIIQAAIDEIEIFGPLQPRPLVSILSQVYSKEEMEKIASNVQNRVELKRVLEKAGKGKSLEALVEIFENFPLE